MNYYYYYYLWCYVWNCVVVETRRVVQGSGAIRLWYELPRRGGAGQEGALTITTYISLIVSWVSRERGHSLLLLFCYVMWYDNIYFYIILIAYKLIRVFYNKIIYSEVHAAEPGAGRPPSVSMSTAIYGSNTVFSFSLSFARSRSLVLSSPSKCFSSERPPPAGNRPPLFSRDKSRFAFLFTIALCTFFWVAFAVPIGAGQS